MSTVARGRPATPLGTWGAINVREIGPKKFEASTYLRHFNGDTSRVRARGKSKTAATNALKKRCAQRLGVDDSKTLTTTSTVSQLMDQWIKTKDDVRPQTKERYENAIETHVKPGFGNMRLNEVGPAFLDG